MSGTLLMSMPRRSLPRSCERRTCQYPPTYSVGSQSMILTARSTGRAPVVFPRLISIAAVSHAAPPSLAGVGTVQKQPAAACVFALTDQTARIRGEEIGCCLEDG